MAWPNQLAPVLADRLAPWLTPATDPTGDHALFLAALAAMGQELYGLTTDYGDPEDPDYTPGAFGAIFDVDLCPTAYLPFLAQVNGTVIPAGTDDATARQLIREENAWRRGTPGAIISAAQRWLSGTQNVDLFERTAADGTTEDPWHFVLVVLTSEVIDAAQLQAAVDAVKPAGVMWTLLETAFWTIAEIEGAYSLVSDVEAAFTTVTHCERDVT